ncbi:hypothetical protein WN944_016997 [Citrus x changshan-huyou]|uniref:Uncharacterized protein n=1 Tax=Citrus x changshan-huyou TaxID=2935761 RepID=A0AAP0MFF9_9ROSI
MTMLCGRALIKCFCEKCVNCLSHLQNTFRRSAFLIFRTFFRRSACLENTSAFFFLHEKCFRLFSQTLQNKCRNYCI